MSHRERSLIWALMLVLVAPLLGGTELVLIDGRVIEGTDVRRDGTDYILTTESGGEIVLPAELVERVKLTAEGEPQGRLTPEGLRVGESQDVAGSPPPEGPTGIRRGEARTVAGDEVRLPRRSEQLEVLGEPSRFQGNIIDNRWVPETDWNMDPVEQNNFAPSTWSKGVVDPAWKPKSAFDADKDVLANNRSTWKKGVVDSSWQPTDGFATSVGRR